MRQESKMFEIRTDLAMETSEQCQNDSQKMRGIEVDTKKLSEEMQLTIVRVTTENGAKQLGKPKGTYVTLEVNNLPEEDEGYHREVSIEIAKIVKNFLPKEKSDLKVLVVGLGNRQVTPDALGPQVVDNLLITRHLLKEYGKYLVEFQHSISVSGMVPGVMAQTGMESVEMMRGVVNETKPDCVIVIDALAARSVKRLNRTIQITDTGIVPGSGVGNHRNAINEKHLGVPVIAIGIPTVVDAATIVADSLEKVLHSFEQEQVETFMEEVISPKLYAMYVTPKDVDESIKRLSFTISEGLNYLFLGEQKTGI